MKRHAKPFDSVRMMRGIRDRLSRQFRGKRVAEQRRLIRADSYDPNPVVARARGSGRWSEP